MAREVFLRRRHWVDTQVRSHGMRGGPTEVETRRQGSGIFVKEQQALVWPEQNSKGSWGEG